MNNTFFQKRKLFEIFNLNFPIIIFREIYMGDINNENNENFKVKYFEN